MYILEIKNLVKHFDGVYALNDFTLRVPKGRVTGIVGPNGSGKSTLINVLSGMISADEGAILLSSRTDIAQAGSVQMVSFGVTRTFQEIRLFEQLTVLDNILLVLTERNVFGALFEKHTNFHISRAEEILKEVRLFEKRFVLVEHLSYGQRKLLEIGRALALGAEIFLFDEPCAGLFPEMIKKIADIVRVLRSQGKTIIVIEHNMQFIRELSDVVAVMEGGRLLAQGIPEEVLLKAEVMEAYLGE